MKCRNYTLFLLLLLATRPMWAQDVQWQQIDRGIEFVNTPQNTVLFPLTGGFSTYKFQLVDMDSDGDDDVFQKESEGRLLFYECVSQATMSYELRTMQYENLDIPNWFRFADIDNDGDQDLFRGNRQGFVTYSQNIGTSETPEFLDAVELTDNASTPIRGDINSFPSFFDVDCDSDIDMLLGDVAGTVSFYSLVGFDVDETPIFQLETERFQDLFIVTGGSTKKPSDEILHGANAFAFVDLLGNDAPALLWGDYFSSRLLMFANDGSCGDMQLDTNYTLFPASNPIHSSGFNAPAVGFINNDDIPDVLIGIGGGAVESGSIDEKPYQRVKIYTGSESQPGSFEELSDPLFSTVDIGDRSAPTFVDIDADGDHDLVIGNQAESESGLNSQLYFFRNTGTNEQPQYNLVSSEFAGMQPTTFAKPAFVDIDNDGDQDLFVGGFNGRLVYSNNGGSPENAAFFPTSEFYQSIDVGSYAAPVFFDSDFDGDFDLLVGNSKGELWFYENLGSADQAVFSSPFVLPIDIGANATPSIAPFSDSTFLLCVGASDRDSLACFVWNKTQLLRIDAPVATLSYSHPAMFRNNNTIHMFMGTSAGGLFAYQTDIVNSVGQQQRSSSTVEYSPKYGTIVVRNHTDGIAPSTSMQVWNLLGQRVPFSRVQVSTHEVHLRLHHKRPIVLAVQVGSSMHVVFTAE